jgi:hypothetical protein
MGKLEVALGQQKCAQAWPRLCVSVWTFIDSCVATLHRFAGAGENSVA